MTNHPTIWCHHHQWGNLFTYNDHKKHYILFQIQKDNRIRSHIYLHKFTKVYQINFWRPKTTFNLKLVLHTYILLLNTCNRIYFQLTTNIYHNTFLPFFLPSFTLSCGDAIWLIQTLQQQESMSWPHKVNHQIDQNNVEENELVSVSNLLYKTYKSPPINDFHMYTLYRHHI